MGVALRDILAPYKRRVGWDGMAGSAAIDAHNALYQFLSIIRQPDGTPLVDADGRITSHLSGLFFRTAKLLEMGVRPVFVYDGDPPALKAATIEARRTLREDAARQYAIAVESGDEAEAYRQARSATRIDDAVIASSQRLLDYLGVPWLVAPSEGEAQAAWMAAEGSVSYAVSQDYDSLLFGAPDLARNITISGRRRLRGRTIAVEPERIRLAEVLEGLGVTREELVEVGILVGTDFNPGIRGVGPKTALKLVREGRFATVLDERIPGFDPRPIREFFLDPPVTNEFMLDWRPPDPEGLREMLCHEYSFSVERVNGALERLGVSAGQRTLDQWF
ncbi:MAG: flap endonuclease-1 [Methanospirillum sp.]|nr:flap endonuclease-1 [Methanospirillum sp.]